MGLSNSVLDIGKVFRSFLSNKPIDAGVVDKLLSCPLSEVEVGQALPVDTIRQMRHFYTKNFAFLLYQCMKEVCTMAGRRAELTNGKLPTREATSRFLTALRVLRNLLPVALEDGTTQLESDLVKPTAGDQQAQATTNSEGATVPLSPPPSRTSTNEDGGDASGAVTETETIAQQRTTDTQGADVAAMVSAVLLQRQSRRERTRATADFQQLFFLDGTTCNDDSPEERFQSFSLPRPQQHSSQQSLGPCFASALVECCFIEEFTLRSRLAATTAAGPNASRTARLSITHPEVDMDLLWYPGLASDDPMSSTTGAAAAAYRASVDMHVARKEVLQTLLSVLSSALYHDANYRDAIFTEPLITASATPLMPTLVVSLLNVVLAYTPYGSLPYTSHMVGEEEKVVVAATRVLDALLCYIGIPLDVRDPAVVGTSDAEGMASSQPTEPTNGTNISAVTNDHGAELLHATQLAEDSTTAFAGAAEGEDASLAVAGASPVAAAAAAGTLSATAEAGARGPHHPWKRLHLVHSVRKTITDITLTEAKYVVEHLGTIVGLRAYSKQTFWPDSQHSLASQDEFMILLWKLLDLSPAMAIQFSSNPLVLSYLVPLMDYAMGVRNNPRLTDQLQLVLFVLLRLSENRIFGVLCNQSFKEFIPFSFPKLPSTSTYHDFVTTSLCLFMETKEQSVFPLCMSCSVVLSNLAPYMTSLGPIASSKLVSTFAQSASRCLRSSDDESERGGMGVIHQTVMVNICEAIASLLQYQGVGSRHVLVALLSHRYLVNRTRDAYQIKQTKKLTIHTVLPFLIDTLDAAVSAALPLVEGTMSNTGGTLFNPDSNGGSGEGTDPQGTVPVAAAGIDNAAVIAKLNDLTLVGVLPTPHRIVAKKFQSTKPIELWALTMFWTNMFAYSTGSFMGDSLSVKMLRFS